MTQQPPPGSSSGLAAMGPRDFLRILRKHVWLIAACFVVLGLGGTAALVAWDRLAPFYTSEGVIAIEPGQQTGGPVDITAAPATIIPPNLFELYVQGQVMIIKSDRVLSNALERVRGLQAMYTTGQASYELNKDLEVAYIPRSQNILVSLTGGNRNELKLIVQAVLDAYREQERQMREESERQRAITLEQQRAELQRQISDIVRQLELQRGEANAVILDERGSEELARLTALVRQLVQQEVELAEARAAWEQFLQLRQQAEDEGTMAPLIMTYPNLTERMRMNATILAMTQQVTRGGQELASLRQRLGPRHESVKRAEATVQEFQNDLETQQNRILGELLQEHAATLKHEYDRAREAEASLRDSVDQARLSAIKVSERAANYRREEAEYERLRGLLDQVQAGIARIRIQAALTQPHIRIAQQASMPVEPSEPKLLLYIPAVIVFSLLVGVGLAFLMEMADTRLRSPAEIARQVGVPLLGSVPDLAEDERLSLDTDVVHVSHTSPQSLLAEAFRQIRTNLLFASDQPLRTLLVSSASPGDGKTTVAANLAITIARSGSRVLLIEGNYRRPSIARAFDIPDRVGLSNVLVGLNPPEEAIQATRIENLDVMVGGTPPPSPADLLGSDRMKQLLQEQAGDYDRVILDGAPVLVVADMHLLSEFVDGVVLVYRAGESKRGVAQRAARQVLDLRGRLLGAVLNGVRATKGGYFREVYQAYYDYSGAEPTAVTSRSTPHEFTARPAPAPPKAETRLESESDIAIELPDEEPDEAEPDEGGTKT